MIHSPTSVRITEGTAADAHFLSIQLERFSRAARPDVSVMPDYEQDLIWTAVAGETIVGGAVAFPDTWPAMYLHVLWVVEPFRGQGLGKALLDAVEGEARRREIQIITLNTYDFQGRDFYLRNGYNEAGQIMDYLPGIHLHYLYKKL